MPSETRFPGAGGPAISNRWVRESPTACVSRVDSYFVCEGLLVLPIQARRELACGSARSPHFGWEGMAQEQGSGPFMRLDCFRVNSQGLGAHLVNAADPA